MRILLLLLIGVLAGGCSGEDSTASFPESACRQQQFEGSRFTVCDPGGGELRLFAAGNGKQPVRSFGE